jgi:hypothetical protein
VRGSDGDYAGINGAGRVLGGMETAPRRACWHVLLEGRVHRYGCGCGYGHGWVKEIKMSRGWLTKDAFLMIVGVWFLVVFLLALDHRRI